MVSLKTKTYSILIVSNGQVFNNALSSLLPEARFNLIRTVSSISAAKRILSDHDMDFIVINSPLPDDIGSRFAIDMCNTSGTVVLFMVKADILNETFERVYEHGVYTLPKPTSKPTLTTALNWMATTRERLRKTEKKTVTLEEKMEEIKVINRAKWLLIGETNMSEAEAHRYIEKQAMDKCVPRVQIAREIIDEHS